VCPQRPRRRAHAVRRHGKAMQLDPIKPPLKAPGNKRLKLNYDKVLSSFAFKINLRRYITGDKIDEVFIGSCMTNIGQGLTLVQFSAQLKHYVLATPVLIPACRAPFFW